MRPSRLLRAAGVAWLLCAGCAYNPVLTPHPPPGHPHLYRNTVVVGNDHVSFLLDRPSGEAALLVTGKDEQPRNIHARELAAEFILPDGARRKVTFEPTSWLCRKGSCMASEYVYKAGWLRQAERFELVATVPIEGAARELRFHYGGQDEHAEGGT